MNNDTKYLDKYKNKIIENNNRLFLPPINAKYIHIKTNSCFDFKNYSSNKGKENIDDFCNAQTNTDIGKYKTKIVDFVPNKTQEIILQNWFISYIEMYNGTIKYIKKYVYMKDVSKLKSILNENKKIKINISSIDKEIKKINNDIKKKKNKDKVNIFKNAKIKLMDTKNILMQRYHYNQKIGYTITDNIQCNINWKHLRTYVIKKQRNNIAENSKQIKVHMLDCAIKDACSSYKSCISNYLSGHIKRFRIRYWTHNKNIKLLEIEKEFIKNGQICESTLGQIKYKYNKEQFELNPLSSVKILYDKKCNKYNLLISEKIDTKNKLNITENYVGIDQGEKALITGISKNSVFKMGTNLSARIRRNLKAIDKINNDDNNGKENKSMRTNKHYRKIKNIVDESHWKMIKHLTENYDTIIIGNLSSKRTGQIKNGDDMSKRALSMLKPSMFRKRLEYKCTIFDRKYLKINESYTTKVCTICAYYNKHITNENTIKCKGCNKEIDRDTQGSRGIVIKALE